MPAGRVGAKIRSGDTPPKNQRREECPATAVTRALVPELCRGVVDPGCVRRGEGEHVKGVSPVRVAVAEGIGHRRVGRFQPVDDGRRGHELGDEAVGPRSARPPSALPRRPARWLARKKSEFGPPRSGPGRARPVIEGGAAEGRWERKALGSSGIPASYQTSVVYSFTIQSCCCKLKTPWTRVRRGGHGGSGKVRSRSSRHRGRSTRRTCSPYTGDEVAVHVVRDPATPRISP